VRIRNLGCARLLGLVLVVIGALVILSYYGLIPHKITRWWPVLVIAFGVWLLFRHYWRVVRDKKAPAVEVLDVLNPQPAALRRRRLVPPVSSLIVIAIGVYLLLSSLHYLSFGVLVAAALILLGLVVLAASARHSVRATFAIRR